MRHGKTFLYFGAGSFDGVPLHPLGAGESHDAAVVTDEEAAFVVRIANVGRLTTKQPQGFGANAALSRSDDPVVDPFVRL